jgi:Cu-Zn family superoxide dismutase
MLRTMKNTNRKNRMALPSEWLGVGVALVLGLGCGGSSSQHAATLPQPPPATTSPTTVEVTGPVAPPPAVEMPVVQAPRAPLAPLAPPAPPPIRAEAELMAMDGSSTVGTVTFEQLGGNVSVIGHFAGLTPGLHGFYVHSGDCGGKRAANAGPHFNPSKMKHGPIGSPVRHVGDFGNLTVDKDGRATFEMTTDSLTVLPGPDSVVGRAIVIHARKDDGKTQPSGSAGPAVACGVIAQGPVMSQVK